jgi:hypothetical protein
MTDTVNMMTISSDRLARFERKTIPEPNSGCLFWLGSVNAQGYGMFWNGSRLERAHRFAYRVFRNPELSSKIFVLHRCDTPGCVNAWHCFEGDAKANTTDMWNKGRAAVTNRYGASVSNAKLTDDEVGKIRLAYALGVANQCELAREYGVSDGAIWAIVHWRTWTKPSGETIEKGRGR